MIKDILFRAKRKDNNEWVYGDLIQACVAVFIVTGVSIIGLEAKKVQVTTVQVDPFSVQQLINSRWHKVKWSE